LEVRYNEFTLHEDRDILFQPSMFLLC